MSRGSWTFKKRELARAVNAMMAAGLEIDRVEIDRSGGFVVVARRRPANSSDNEQGEEGEWDEI
jgi:hypothetical protein